jgi:hypothetical protein
MTMRAGQPHQDGANLAQRRSRVAGNLRGETDSVDQ